MPDSLDTSAWVYLWFSNLHLIGKFSSSLLQTGSILYSTLHRSQVGSCPTSLNACSGIVYLWFSDR